MLNTYNTSGPTEIFNALLKNEDFARRYLRRAKDVLCDEGLLGETSVVEVWDSLYNNISMALYDEAARWGDYRKNVHRWQSPGQLYTVDEHYMAERNRLLTEYFPVRTARVLSDIIKYLPASIVNGIDDVQRLSVQREVVYNLQGQPVSKLKKGIYIRDGKKIIVR